MTRVALPKRLALALGVALGVGLGIGLGVAACAPAAPAESGPGAIDGTMPPLLAGLELTTVTIGSRELMVGIADTPDARSRGLAGTTDIGPLDGLLFAYDAPVETGFFMRGVLMPLDIAFVDADGRVLAVETMPLCAADPCPTFAPPSPFRWAIETPAGGLSGVAVGDLVEIASG